MDDNLFNAVRPLARIWAWTAQPNRDDIHISFFWLEHGALAPVLTWVWGHSGKIIDYTSHIIKSKCSHQLKLMAEQMRQDANTEANKQDLQELQVQISEQSQGKSMSLPCAYWYSLKSKHQDLGQRLICCIAHFGICALRSQLGCKKCPFLAHLRAKHRYVPVKVFIVSWLTIYHVQILLYHIYKLVSYLHVINQLSNQCIEQSQSSSALTPRLYIS